MFGEYPVTKIMRQLAEDRLLPAILFRTARRQCDHDIEVLMGGRWSGIDSVEQAKLLNGIQAISAKYRFDAQIITGHAHYPALLKTACGAHHAGQLLVWRLLLEELMTQGLLRLMIATGTVAAGVDFPARTVVITAHSKRGAEGFNTLTASEFQQMSGRAGRRGKDTLGICLVAPSVFSDARVIHELTLRSAEPLRSAYFAAPATVLNLLKYRNVDDLRFTVSRSLAAFLDRKTAQQMRAESERDLDALQGPETMSEMTRKRTERRLRRQLREAELIEGRQVELLERSLVGLEKLGHVTRGSLSPKGNWAANLCTSLVLELAEAIDQHLFEDLSAEVLAGAVAAVAGDPHRPYFSLKPNPIKKDFFRTMEGVVAHVRSCYAGANPDIKVLPDAALTVMTWCAAQSWQEFAGLLRLAGVADGDVARLVSQTADHLNQISRLGETHTELARTAAEARRLLLRPPFSEETVVEG